MRSADGPAPADPTSSPALAIVGAGPVGLYAAYYAGFRGLATVVFEALPFVGGQITAFYEATDIFDVPGFPRIRGEELVARLRTQALSFETTQIRLGQTVTGLSADPDDGHWHIDHRAADGAEGRLEVPAVLATAGIGPFAPQTSGNPDIDAYCGRGLSFGGLSDASPNGPTLVVGGTGSAVTTAIESSRRGLPVTLVHRRDRLTISDALREELDASAVTFLPFQELVGIRGTTAVETARLRHRKSGDESELAVERIHAFHGFAAASKHTASLIDGHDDAALPVRSNMATKWRGLYAAGDVATYDGKVKLLAAEFGEACTAVNNICAEVFGGPAFPGYSSHSKGQARPIRREGTGH